jgi:hypothetical protein
VVAPLRAFPSTKKSTYEDEALIAEALHTLVKLGLAGRMAWVAGFAASHLRRNACLAASQYGQPRPYQRSYRLRGVQR